jgi:hypothetical protein
MLFVSPPTNAQCVLSNKVVKGRSSRGPQLSHVYEHNHINWVWFPAIFIDYIIRIYNLSPSQYTPSENPIIASSILIPILHLLSPG